MKDTTKAFIAGAEYWEYINTGFCNTWPTRERERVEKEAIRRYGKPEKKETPCKLQKQSQ
jgi:hypothetical protein